MTLVQNGFSLGADLANLITNVASGSEGTVKNTLLFTFFCVNEKYSDAFEMFRCVAGEEIHVSALKTLKGSKTHSEFVWCNNKVV